MLAGDFLCAIKAKKYQKGTVNFENPSSVTA